MTQSVLDHLVDAAIREDFYTADGERVMLPLQALVDLGLVDASAVDQLKQRLDAWNAAQAAQQPHNGEMPCSIALHGRDRCADR